MSQIFSKAYKKEKITAFALHEDWNDIESKNYDQIIQEK